MIEEGTKLGRYEIRSKIGEGGMGEVYLAEDTKLHRRVAIKFLPADSVANEQANKRLLREAQAAAKLDHPNICAVHEIAEEDGRSFIVMPYIEGETLDVRMKRKPLGLSDSLTIATQVADALAEAHAHGITHRDIKPSNIIITSRDRAKVMDFGLAKLSGVLGAADVLNVGAEASTEALLTTPGTIVGTVPYMSPEQVHGQSVDARTDIFSFGVVLYEMLSGRQPFAAESGAATISAIISKEPPPITHYVTQCPEELQRIVRKCLEKDRDRRYQTMRDLALDLENCRREFEAARTTSQVERRTQGEKTTTTVEVMKQASYISSRTIAMGAALLAVAVAAVLIYVFVFRRSAANSRPAEIKSLAVLPLKSLDAGDNYLGLGIADAVIRRISQTAGLTVRPTSAVRRYLNDDTDALTAARQLAADAVLEGNVQRANDRLRVSVNLLRTSDGTSLWTNNFDMQATDIFVIQDTVAQQVASRLRLQLDPAQQARSSKPSTSSPIAYEFYSKGVYSLDLLYAHGYGKDGKAQAEGTIELFKKAIEADPNYALAHAQLANAYVYIALFVEATEPAWVDRAREEINRAQALDPQLAETHIARAELLWSAYEGWQIEAAIRELHNAQQINPNVGRDILAALYQHAGLEDLSAHELQRALEIDPTSESVRSLFIDMASIVKKYDQASAAAQKFGLSKPNTWYLLMKEIDAGHVDDAQKAVEQLAAKNPDGIGLSEARALIFALKGDFHSAEAAIPSILKNYSMKTPAYHHGTYNIACVYALEGKGDEAVKWLKETANTGFPCYPLFARDHLLDRIRQAPAFAQFMTEMKAQNERLRREFAEGATQ
jgi:serine/threonine protein kinase/tetratricopeptide (TPR) repeat protein